MNDGLKLLLNVSARSIFKSKYVLVQITQGVFWTGPTLISADNKPLNVPAFSELVTSKRLKIYKSLAIIQY
jgi:hypothetical protein